MADRTVRLHRVLRSTPQKIYRAFLELEPGERIRYPEAIPPISTPRFHV